VSSERGVRLATSFLVGFLFACSVPVPFADDLFFSTAAQQLPVAEDCRRCHGDVVTEGRSRRMRTPGPRSTSRR
jgi:hypothetical protein